MPRRFPDTGDSACAVGRAIVPAAAFQAACSKEPRPLPERRPRMSRQSLPCCGAGFILRRASARHSVEASRAVSLKGALA